MLQIRNVTCSLKVNGVIEKLGGRDAWSPRSKDEVIGDIEAGICEYRIDDKRHTRARLTVEVDSSGVKSITTDPDTTKKNHLLEIDDCV